MPELPDVTVYVEALAARITGQRLEGVRVASPFLLRSVEPPLATVGGRAVAGVRRMGKRIVIDLEGDVHLVLHLMIAGRLHWKPGRAPEGGRRGSAPVAGSPRWPISGRVGLAAFDFSSGSLLLTEAGTKKRAALHLVAGEAALRQFDPGGLEVLQADLAAFRGALARERHTLKRALTDPGLISGIGNAYADEILHRARLSPVGLTDRLDPDAVARLYDAARGTLLDWIARLRAEAGAGFPEKVTAFREGMAVHGRYGRPCPDCGAPVQRIVRAENETNYCPRCQTGGRLLADRALSRLLRADWPRTLEELEERRGPGGAPAPPVAPRPGSRRRARRARTGGS